MKVFLARLDDSTFTLQDQIEELKQWKNLPTEYQIIEHYMAIGDHESALERYAQIPEICDLNRQANQDYEIFYEWMNLSRAISEDNQYMDSLPISFIEQVQFLADTYPYSYAGSKAKQLMNEYYNGAYQQEPYVPFEAPSLKSMTRKESHIEAQLMQVYPDPASDLTNIQLSLPAEIFRQGVIRISDITGKMIMELKVNHFNQFFTLNLSDWQNGVYSVSLYTGERLVFSKKLNVVK